MVAVVGTSFDHLFFTRNVAARLRCGGIFSESIFDEGTEKSMVSPFLLTHSVSLCDKNISDMDTEQRAVSVPQMSFALHYAHGIRI